MAEAAGVAIGAAAAVASKWAGPSSFTARHEDTHKKGADNLQQHIDRWYKGIPDLEVESSEEEEFHRLQTEARAKGKQYRESIQDYKQASVLKPREKVKVRHKVRDLKRESRQSLHSLEDLVSTVSDRSQTRSRASSIVASEASTDSESTRATTDSPPQRNMRNEDIAEWRQNLDSFQGFGGGALGEDVDNEKGKVRPEETNFPKRDLADKLVDAYFSQLHFLMPIVDKPSFLRRYNDIMSDSQINLLIRKDAVFISVLFAIFACAVNLVQDHKLLKEGRAEGGGMGTLYYEQSLVFQRLSHADTQLTLIPHVQCFVLLASFLFSVNRLSEARDLVGQAVRTGQDLGLHRSPHRLVITPIEKETRRKVWWGVYILDRMLAVALGRPLGISDSDCDVEMPVDVDDDNLPEYFSGALMSPNTLSLMKGTNFLIKLYRIGGRVLRDVYAIEYCKDHLEPERKAELQRMVELLDIELTQWCEDLPAEFKVQANRDEQLSMAAVLGSHYYSVLTTLHRNMLPVKRDGPVAPKSVMKAVSSARSCIYLTPSMKMFVPPSHHLAFFIQHLFSSAVILLLYAMHSSEPRAASAAMDEAKSSLSALESWEGQWPGAKKCRERLIDLVDTASEFIAHAAQHQQQQIPNAYAGESGGGGEMISVAGRVLPVNVAPLKILKKRPSSRKLAASLLKSARARSASHSRPVRDVQIDVEQVESSKDASGSSSVLHSSSESTSSHDLPNELSGLAIASPAPSFDAPGLPFHGLDLIRNHTFSRHFADRKLYAIMQAPSSVRH